MKTSHKVTLKIQKEMKITYPLYSAELDDGVKINVYGDYAVSNNGDTYYHIGKEIDGVLHTVGWCRDISKPVISD